MDFFLKIVRQLADSYLEALPELTANYTEGERMKAQWINPFLDATLNVLSTMAQTSATAGKPHLKNDSKTFGEITGIIGMSGSNVAGNLIISFDQKVILDVVSKMLGEAYEEINKDIVDAVGEITNMICGNAKTELAPLGLDIQMATPIMLCGKGTDINQLGETPVIVIPFTTANGPFVVEASLATKK